MNKLYSLGIDVGSTTVKTVILDGDNIIYNKYERHFSKVRETVAQQLKIIRDMYKGDKFKIAITGSAGLGNCRSLWNNLCSGGFLCVYCC